MIANADVVGTLTDLSGAWQLPKRFGQRVQQLRRGPSAILLSLALDILPDLPARIFVSANGLHFGIGNPSAIDPTLAPSGFAALTILCLLSEEEAATWLDANDAGYKARKEAFARRLIAAAETVIPNLRQHILYRQTASPKTFARYARTRNGNIYGAACGQWRPAVKSPGARPAAGRRGMSGRSRDRGGRTFRHARRQPHSLRASRGSGPRGRSRSLLLSHFVVLERYESDRGAEFSTRAASDNHITLTP